MTGPVRERISAAQARRIALAAQGFMNPRPGGRMDARHLRRVLDRVGLFQIDSVNVLVRAHYLPLFSRLGAYPTALLERSSYGPRRELFEYWAHEASLVPVSHQPLFRWRMERAARGGGIYGSLARFGVERRDYIDAVLAEIAARGPLAASDLAEGERGQGAWWGWSDGKHALEWLFWAGFVTTATRRAGFERVYDLTERVLPAEVLAAPTPSPEDAQRTLIRLAARSFGIAAEGDLRDYYRLEAAEARARIAELVEEGGLIPVSVEGWRQPAYLSADAPMPRRVMACALLAPFDPLVWERSRTERLFGFRYRLEIYTPAPKREYGYYVLPFLFGDRLVGRVDLKANRSAGCLEARAAHAEPGAATPEAAEALATELRRMADWLGLERVAVWPHGEFGRLLNRDAVAGPMALPS